MYVVAIHVNDHIAVLESSSDRIRAADLLDEHFARLCERRGDRYDIRIQADLWDLCAEHRGLPRTTCRVRTQGSRAVRTSTLEGIADALVAVQR